MIMKTRPSAERRGFAFVWFLAVLAIGVFGQNRPPVPIHIEKSFPSEELAEKGIYLLEAIHMAQAPNGDFYVSNTKDGQILHFDANGRFIRRFGTKGKGPYEILAPQNILLKKDAIIVQDIGNRKLAYFDAQGKLFKYWPLSKQYDAMIVDEEKGSIYATPMDLLPGNKLIEVLDLEGRHRAAFGEPQDFTRRTAEANAGVLALTDQHDIVFGFQFLPMLRKYSQQGNLLSEHKIHYSRLVENEKKNRRAFAASDADMHPPSLSYILNDLRIWQGRIFVLNCSPYVEILELDEKGFVKSTYQSREQPDYFSMSFLVREIDRRLNFLVLQRLPDNVIDIYGRKSDERDPASAR